MRLNYTISALIICIGSFSAVAQDDTLKTEDIIIVNPYDPTISDAFKLNDQPQNVEYNVENPKVDLVQHSKQMDTQYDVDPIKPAKMRGEPLPKLYRGYLKGGLGNYLNTSLEASFSNKRSRKHSYGAHLNHIGTGGQLNDVGYSGFSESSLDIYGKKFLRKHMVKGALIGSSDVSHRYAYDINDAPDLSRKDIQQRYSKVAFNGGLMSFYKDSAMINHDIDLDYYMLDDLYGAQEHNIVLNAAGRRYMNQELLKLDFGFDYNNLIVKEKEKGSPVNYSSADAIIKIHPHIVSKGDQWRLDVGLSSFTESGENTYFRFYPAAHFKYNVLKEVIIPYIGVKGGVTRTNLESLRNENPFIDSDVMLLNEQERYNAYAGVRGALSSHWAFNIRGSKRYVNNMPFYVNDAADGSYNSLFAVIYDTVEVVSVDGELSYLRNEKLSLMARGAYNYYNMKTEEEAWNMPKFKAGISARYKMKDKIVLKADVFYQSMRYTRSMSSDDDTNLPLGYGVYAKRLNSIIDINVGVEYRYNKNLSAFLNVNNLAASKYNYWNTYPTQRFNVLGGLTYSLWNK